MALLAVASPLKTLYPNPNPRPVRRRLHRSSILHLSPLLTRSGRLRCSAAYGEAAAATPTTPRPDEIPWSRDLCNSVRLIGTVGTDVELRRLPSGAAVARGRIAVWKSATETTWVTLAFWDDLAVVASEHVKKGDRIYVSGRLVSDTVDEGPEKRQVYYKVVVQQLNFIESFQPVQLYEPEPSQDTQAWVNTHRCSPYHGPILVGTGTSPLLWRPTKVENVEIMLILPLVQLRIKIGITPVPLVQLKSCGKPSLLIRLTGGITGQIRRTRGIRTLSTSTLVKHCGLMGGTTPFGLSLNWQFWTREWVLCKTLRESQSPLCMLMTSWCLAPTLKSLFEGGHFAIPN